MSNGGGTTGSRVSIPSGARKTIQNIKEITGCHEDEDIYAMLRACSMDPNETTQKLLFEDSFHEVKRKRDRKKENVSSKEPVDVISKFGVQGRVVRIPRGKNPPRNFSFDTDYAKNPKVDKESFANQGSHKDKTSIAQNTADKSALPTSISFSRIANEPNKQALVVSPHQTTSKMPFISRQCFPEIQKPSSWLEVVSDSRVYTTVSDPIVETSLELSTATKNHPRSQEIYVEPTSNNAPSPEEFQQTFSSTTTSVSRPSSSYSNQSQQSIGHKKATTEIELKPTQANTNIFHSTGKSVNLHVSSVAEGTSPINKASEEFSSNLQKKLELHFSDEQHVIFPSHIHVPESERTILSFGSFTSNSTISTVISSSVNAFDNCDSSLPPSNLSKKLEEDVEESSLSNEIGPLEVQGIDSSVYPQSPEHIPENLSSGDSEISNIFARQEIDQFQHEPSFPSGLQYSVVQTEPTDSTFGLIPPMVGTKITTSENSESSQGHNGSSIPGFFVQQPFDPSINYYTHVYHTGANGDGCYHPLGESEAKYITALTSQTDQSQKESENSITRHSSGLAVTQTPALIESSASVTQQSVPVFRQPTGVPIPYYPSNYMPYGPYFHPFYLSNHHVPPFIGNANFPQQHPISSSYPSATTAASHVKYPVSQYKTGSNGTHPIHVGITTGYEMFNPNANIANLAENSELSNSQLKDNNVHLSGQQNEESPHWIPAPGRDVPVLQPSSFYNFHPQGQHMAYPSQAVHGALPGLFHSNQMPSVTGGPLLQTGAVEMVGHQTGIYPQPQQNPSINWGNNY